MEVVCGVEETKHRKGWSVRRLREGLRRSLIPQPEQ